MFSVTYLGQQGWLLAGAKGRVLVDPLLTDEYSPGFEAEVYPPRTFEHRKFPPIDAVVLSHEHADHLNLPSLALLDRRVPIVLPARAALPLRDALVDLGFRVLPATPGAAFAAGDLVIRTLGGELQRDAELDSEWTTLQILVSDRAGDGSFFSYVDSWPSADTLAAIHRAVGRVGVFCHANNTMDWSCLEAGVAGWPRATLDYAAEVIAAEAAWWRDHPAPAHTVVCGPGLAFVGKDAWMNQILCADSARVCEALRALAPERSFGAPIPGETLTLARGRVRRRAPKTSFVRPRDRAQWPSIAVRKRRELIEDFAPACGQRALAGGAWPVIRRELDRLAGYLHRRSLFRTLLALDRRALGRRRPDFALVLRCDDDDSAFVYEYQPAGCRFAPVEGSEPFETYVAGLECWASDLFRVVSGQFLPQRLLGHVRTWSHSPIPLSPLTAVWGFFDLAYRPGAAAAFYRAVADRVRGAEPVIAAGQGARVLRVKE
jgi:hypothetical protein